MNDRDDTKERNWIEFVVHCWKTQRVRFWKWAIELYMAFVLTVILLMEANK